ncbi:MAG: ATP-binding cassette domain-containing protein, partial [Spirochaetales bacterium]
MISIKNVSFGYEKNKEIIHNLCLEIEKGECILLCGESGCGKSTITKMMNGLIPHFTNCGYLNGTVSVGGLSVADSKLYELSKHIGSVFQNPKSQFFYTESDGELE